MELNWIFKYIIELDWLEQKIGSLNSKIGIDNSDFLNLGLTNPNMPIPSIHLNLKKKRKKDWP